MEYSVYQGTQYKTMKNVNADSVKKKTTKETLSLKLEDFEKSFDDTLSSFFASKVKEHKVVLERLSQLERDEIILKIIKELSNPSVVRAGEERRGQWDLGWKENLESFLDTRDVDFLLPRYFGKYPIIRWNQDLYRVSNSRDEVNMLALVEYWIFEKYLSDLPAVYEFGCGTGHNLIRLREVNKKAKLVGLDWAKSSQEIISKLVDKNILTNAGCYNFDFFHPDSSLALDSASGVYTVAALEQIGPNFLPFVDFILSKKPKICVHIEPIAELLDETNLIDFLSVQYFKKRHYLDGFLSHLEDLESTGKIKLLSTKRSYVGSLFVDGYSIIVWYPL